MKRTAPTGKHGDLDLLLFPTAENFLVFKFIFSVCFKTSSSVGLVNIYSAFILFNVTVTLLFGFTFIWGEARHPWVPQFLFSAASFFV